MTCNKSNFVLLKRDIWMYTEINEKKPRRNDKSKYLPPLLPVDPLIVGPVGIHRSNRMSNIFNFFGVVKFKCRWFVAASRPATTLILSTKHPWAEYGNRRFINKWPTGGDTPRFPVIYRKTANCANHFYWTFFFLYNFL